MNILAKRLHSEADPHDIVHKAHEQGAARPMPFVESGPHRAFCSVIIGPAAVWAHAREAVRYRAIKRLRRAIRVAWARTWSRGVSLFDGTKERGSYKALLISPEDGWLKISAFSARGFADAAKLGWEWLTGNWQDAATVDNVRSAHVTVRGPPAIHALFDGEEVMLKSPALVSSGVSNLSFVATVEAP
jgi:diacylglycerol kinase family enzyme